MSTDYRDAWVELLKEYDAYFSKIVFGCFNFIGYESATNTENETMPKKELTTLVKQEVATKLRAVAEKCPRYGDQNWGAELFAYPNSREHEVYVHRLQEHIIT